MRTKFITAAIVALATISLLGQQKAAAPTAAPTKVTVYKSPT